LAKATVAALQDPSARDIIRSQAAVVVGNTKAEFGQFIRAESAKYGKIVALTGVRLN
jgi:tripartite-type tricarboxylate transporter receptor subunit TctC